MAGEIQLNGTTALTESGGAITLNNVNSETNRTNLGMGGFTGMIASFAMSSAPTGWLVCNGAEYAIATYGDLYTAIGTTWGSLTNGSGGAGSTHFVVPDLRGEFLRGFDNGTGNDPDASSRTGGDAVGSSQTGINASHSHYVAVNNTQTTEFGTNTNTHSIASSFTLGTADYDRYNLATVNATPNRGVSSTSGGNETRPRNKYVQYCIKY